FKDEEVNMLKDAAFKKLSKQNYRYTIAGVLYKNGSSAPELLEKTTHENLLSGRERWIYENPNGKWVKRYEYIRIGKNQFSKFDTKPWEKVESQYNWSQSGGGGGDFSIVKIEDKTERKLTKDQTLNNQKVDLYETIETTVYSRQKTTFSTITTKKYWFDKSGLFVKE